MHCFGQQGLMPALDSDMAEVITGSEFIVKANAERDFLTATAINDLIKNVLKNPQFNLKEFTLICCSACRGLLTLIVAT